ncbi:hypothetical protein DL96DRAFT_709527 [Flagelloscypha sp. PMI_526]|nr:hypothetical protein DL96DRAFT_709527 [Flagelloscypha sp. PMI_526]
MYEEPNALAKSDATLKPTDLVPHADEGIDPFLVDDPDSDDDDNTQTRHAPATLGLPAHQIPLSYPVSAPPTSTASQFPPLPQTRNKAVPPTPEEDSDPEEEDVPEIYLPGLVATTMFLPIPNTDPLSTLMNKHVPAERRPARDTTGEWQRSDFHTLVMTNSWRSLARMARDRLVSADPEDLSLVLGLWYLRLSSLSRLRLFNQTSAECANLFNVLNAVEKPDARAWLFDRLLPFELEVMYVRIKYWSGDHMGYLDALYALLKKCRSKARLSDPSQPNVLAMWKERGSRIALIIASQLVEMKDLSAAASILEPLCRQPTPSPTLQSAVARIYLQSGNIPMAKKHFEAVEKCADADETTKDVNAALMACADGDWIEAEERLMKILEEDAENYMAVNNLAVALLCQGRMKEGITVLEKAMGVSPSSVLVAEPFLFNLSTLYELRSANSIELKRGLLVDVAKWSGDGLRTACLKMPST